ncbi:MAG: AsmA-like C-terminal region-containing protein [Chthoniobacterales bacterium]
MSNYRNLTSEPSWIECAETVARHSASLLFRLLFIVVVAGIPLLLLIARFYGLGHNIRHRVEKALAGQFYEVKIHRLLFSLSDGLIAEDLRLLENNPSHRLLVHANRVTIFPNLSALSRGIIQIDFFQLNRTTIDIPLGNKEEPRLRLDHVEANIICPPGQIILSNANFDLYGIHTHASGHFLNPKTFAPHAVATEEPGKIAQTIERIEQTLESITWSGSPPTLDIEASGDLTDTTSLRIDHAFFHSGPCHYGPWNLTAVSADIEYANAQLKLQQLSLEDTKGDFHITGSADFQESQAALNFLGTCDIAAVAAIAFSKDMFAECLWIDPPHLEGSCTASWKSGKPLIQGEAHVETGRFTYCGISMDRFSLGCTYQGDRFLVRDLQLVGEPGSLEADIMSAPNDHRLRVHASLLPQYLVPAAKGPLQHFLSLLNFKDPLQFTFEGSAPKLDPLACSGSGTLHLGSSSVRGAWIDILNANFQMKDGFVDFQNILAKIGEGTATGECIYDFKNQEIRFPGIQSTVDPITVMMWIDPRIAQSLKEYRFHVPPEVHTTGRLGIKDPSKNDFTIQISAPQGLDYTLLKRNVTFTKAAGTVIIRKQELLIDLPDASLFGGNVKIQAHASIAPDNSHYSADVNLDSIDFKSVTKLYFDYDTSEGQLNGAYHFSTLSNDAYAMKGQGHLLIKNGNVLAMPIFGPLSVLMNEIYPGLGYQAARRATADFTVNQGVITTKNLSIQSAEFSMIGSGDIFYLEDHINMNMRLNVKGLPGLVLFPVSKLFEYVWDGSLKNSTWRPKYMTLPKLHSK